MTSPILITGGTGFVGSHLIHFLKAKSAPIVVLSSTASPHPDPAVHYYRADVRNRDALQGIIRDVGPGEIYHLAGISAVGAAWENPRLTFEVNVLGALNVFEAGMALPIAARILNVSTAQVYGRSPMPLTEKSPVSPDNPYSASKAMAELLRVEFRDYPNGGVVTVRPFNHTGPGQTPNFVLPSIARQFAEIEAGMRPAKLSLGNIQVRRDFTDVRDVVEAYALLLEKGRPGEIYNVCSGASVALSEIIKLFEAACNLKVEIETDPGKVRRDEAGEIYGDPVKTRSETGWVPRIPLTRTVADLMEYWRQPQKSQASSP